MAKHYGIVAVFVASISSVAPLPAVSMATATVSPPGLILAYFGGSELPAELREQVGVEIGAVFEGLPVDVRWVDGTTIRPPAGNVLRVIFIDRVPDEWGLAPNVLGAVVGSQFPPSVVYVFHRNVLRELAVDIATLTRALTADVVRALARVVAHELVHAYAPTHGHRRNGLMAPGLGPEALARRPTTIDRKCLEALLHGLTIASSPRAGDE